jgi:fructokinase
MILVCGEALIDMVPLPASPEQPAYVAKGGGSLFNVAMGLGRLEVPVAFFGRLSRDPFGRMMRRQLGDDGVDLRFALDGDEPSTLAIVFLEAGAEPVYTFHDEGAADRMLRVEDVPATLPDAVRALHFGSISLLREPAASAYETLMRREHGRRLVSLDPNVRPGLIHDRAAYVARLEGWVALADLVKVSRADLEWLYPDAAPEAAATAWLGRGPAAVVMTRGGDGAVAFAADGLAEVPGIAVAVSDTVGAGDSFTSGLLAWLERAGRLDRDAIRGVTAEELRAALTFANTAASITCTRPGAQPPTLAEMRERGLA